MVTDELMKLVTFYATALKQKCAFGCLPTTFSLARPKTEPYVVVDFFMYIFFLMNRAPELCSHPL